MILNNLKGKVFAGAQQVSQIYHGTVPLWTDDELDLNQDTQIAFLFDTTGSMSSQIAGVRILAAAVAAKAVELESNVQIALACFKDDNNDGFSPSINFTDINTFLSSMPISTRGGGDAAENGFGAIVYARRTFTWDPAFNHSIFLFTDNPSNQKGAAIGAAQAALTEINASFYYGIRPCPGNYQTLSDATGGFFFNSVESFTSQIAAQQASE